MELKKCRACGIEKHSTEDYYSRIKDGKEYWTGKCKSCVKKGIPIDPSIKTNRGRPKNEIVDGKRYCPRCETNRTVDEFYNLNNSYCRHCVMEYNRSYKKKRKYYNFNKNDIKIDKNEILRYIWAIITRGYGVNVIDFYKIIHYHQYLFPSYQDGEMLFTTEIKDKWDKLEKWYEENKGEWNIHN